MASAAEQLAANLNFGVISFYKKQRDEIMKALVQYGLAVEIGDDFDIAPDYKKLNIKNNGSMESLERLRVGTVDAFQGKEFDVVFLSMVRSNHYSDNSSKERQKKYGHLMSHNRLCVSMSRQKKILIVVGDSGMLTASNAQEAIGPLVEFYTLCREKGIVIE